VDWAVFEDMGWGDVSMLQTSSSPVVSVISSVAMDHRNFWETICFCVPGKTWDSEKEHTFDSGLQTQMKML
jgi:hypothetical protein